MIGLSLNKIFPIWAKLNFLIEDLHSIFILYREDTEYMDFKFLNNISGETLIPFSNYSQVLPEQL